MRVLSCEHLNLAYGPVPVVQDVSFAIDEGSYLAIIGHNGSGKTTLFKGLLGLLSPLSGQVYVGGDGRVGYLPQSDSIQPHFPASVREVVASGLLNRKPLFAVYTAADKRLVEKSLARLDMLPLADRPFQTLSGGQRQRVLLARALTASERLLFLDEPTAGLDPAAEQELYRLLAQLNRQEGVTIVTISHDLAAVRDYATHVLVMSHGQMSFFGDRAAYGRRLREEGGGHADLSV